MDDVVEQLEAADISGKDENYFQQLYKNNGKTSNQEDRRQNILNTQKVNRYTKLDRFRGILNLVEAVQEDIFRTPKTFWNPKVFVTGYNKIPNYCDVLMMSEWMVQKPSDFEEKWCVLPCPKGHRMLVVAHQGITKCFNKYGNFKFECRTLLPGGGPSESQSYKKTVVLDCFLVREDRTMYVLDVLAWNNYVMTEGEASFRYFWVKSQLAELPGLTTITKKNELKFKMIPKFPCTKESLNEFLSNFPFYNHNQPPVDGLLLYHQEAHYFAGETPVVGWLYPFMVHEVLGQDYTVHKGYMLEQPAPYNGYMDFIEKFENTNRRKRQKKIFQPKNMEIEPDALASTSGVSIERAPRNENVEQTNMEFDNNTFAQGDNAGLRSTIQNKGKSKEGENATRRTKSKKKLTEKMEADISIGNNSTAKKYNWRDNTDMENNLEAATNMGNMLVASSNETGPDTKMENNWGSNTNMGDNLGAATNMENMLLATNNEMGPDTNMENNANSTSNKTIAADIATGNQMEAMVADIVEEKK